jgi:hypothetical protein
MKKYLVLMVMTLAIAVYIASHDKQAAKQIAQDAARLRNQTPIAIANEQISQDDVEKAKRNAPSWFAFFRWPEGAGAIALILTLFAIAEQTEATRKAAEAAKRNVEVFIAAQKPQIVVTAHGNPVHDFMGDVPRVQMELENRGPTTALGLLHESWIEILSPPFEDFTTKADYHKWNTPISVYPGQRPVILNIPLKSGMTPAEAEDIRRLRKRVWIRVRATYRDGLSKKSQWVSFGYWLQSDGLGFLDKYNDSGEEEAAN